MKNMFLFCCLYTLYICIYTCIDNSQFPGLLQLGLLHQYYIDVQISGLEDHKASQQLDLSSHLAAGRWCRQ